MTDLVLDSRVLDIGLTVLDTESDNFYVCSAEPTTYTEATATFALGSKSFTRGSAFGSASGSSSPTGRKVISASITDGSVSANGTVSHWAVVDSTNTRLLARGVLTGGVAVTIGQGFTLSPITITLPSGSSIWTPADLATALRLWIKADTGTSTSGGLIDSIADQSGNGFNLVSGITNRPTLNATGYNGLPSIDFSAASSTYLCTQLLPTVTSSQNFSLGTSSSFFFIGQMDTGAGSYGRLMSYLGGVTASGSGADFASTDCVAAILRNSTTDAVCMYQAALAAGASGAVSLNTNMRVLMVFDNANATLYINNAQVAQDPVSFDLGATGVFSLGAEITASAGGINLGLGMWDGTVAEMLITNTALDVTTRANLDAYVVARLGA